MKDRHHGGLFSVLCNARTCNSFPWLICREWRPRHSAGGETRPYIICGSGKQLPQMM